MDRTKAIDEPRICTSIIVSAELRYGMTQKASPHLTAQIEAVIGAIDTLPLASLADENYGSPNTNAGLLPKA